MTELSSSNIGNNKYIHDSRDVAKLIDKRHDHLLRDIRRYIKQMDENGNVDSADFFKESTYIDRLNRAKPCYLLTKQGRELVGLRLRGARGTQFALNYIERAHEMNEKLAHDQTGRLTHDDAISRAISYIEQQQQQQRQQLQ